MRLTTNSSIFRTLRTALPWVVFFLSLVPAMARAQDALRLQPDVAAASLEGHLQALPDPHATMTVGDADAATAWQPVVGMPAFGFTTGAMWLRFTLEQPGPAAAPWRLELGNALLEGVTLFQRQPSGAWTEQHAGLDLAHDRWPVATRSPVFRLDLSPGVHTFVLRLSTRASMVTSLTVWEPEAFYARSTNEALAWGVYFGIYVLVIVMQAMFWLWTREKISGWYILYASLHLVSLLLTAGYPQKLLALQGETAMTVLGIALCLLLGVGVRYASIFLELRSALPWADRLIAHIGLAVTVISAGLVLSGRYGTGVPIAQLTSIALLLVHTGISIVLMRRGHAPARHFLYLFGCFYLGALIRYSGNLNLLPPSVLTLYSVQVGSLLHIVAMNIFIIYRYHLLRKSIEVERGVLQQQRDFVAMVSHEFRTPLAIINTTVQQLAADPRSSAEKFQRRCTNIKAAVRRMVDMMDNYLTTERMEAARQAISTQRCGPLPLLRQVVAEWPAHRLRLDAAGLPDEVGCAPDILRLALRNLIANADRHAPADTVIDVRSRHRDGTWTIEVQDAGPGIPAEEMPRLFQKYVRGQNAQGQPGAGLGLYIVRDVVEAHGGTVSARSRPGETVFEVRLPGPAAALSR